MQGAVYKGRLAQELAADLNISPHFSRRILSAICARIESHLLAGRRVVLSGFGEFHTKRVGAKRMRVGYLNGRTIQIEPHRVPAWRASDSLKQRVRRAKAGAGSPLARSGQAPGPSHASGGQGSLRPGAAGASGQGRGGLAHPQG